MERRRKTSLLHREKEKLISREKIVNRIAEGKKG